MLTSSMLGPATDREIVALQQAVQWPNAAPGALLAFTTQLVAAGRYERGLQHFRRAAQAQPQNPVLRALAGYFAVLSADVERGIADLTWACERQPGLPHYLRGLAVAELPLDADHARGVVADLELVLALRDHLPTGFMRGAHRALALAYRTLGRDDDARAAQRRSGLDGVSDDVRLLFTDYWANPNDGFRFHSPRLLQPATGVHLAQGYDFGDFALAETSSRPVAIDAGSTSTRVRAALTDLETPGPVGHVILTHAHWDHIGGLDALAGANTQIIAQSQFPAELALQHHSHLPYRYFLGTEGRLDHHVTPDHLIDSPSELTIGGRRFTLIPVTGGETSDALLVHLPEERLTFTGDVLMPYLGAPFFPEGN